MLGLVRRGGGARWLSEQVTKNKLHGTTSDIVSNKTSLVFRIPDRTGALQDVLQFFWKYDINMTRIESRPTHENDQVEFFVSIDGSPTAPSTKKLLKNLKASVASIEVAESPLVTWFPRKPSDIDFLSQKTLDAGEELEADHPGFSDDTYRERRRMITAAAKSFRYGQPIPHMDYTQNEIETWGTIWDHLKPNLDKYACKSHRKMLPLMMENCGYRRDNIPQLNDVSNFLQDCTGFNLRPVAGLLSARDFFYGLAFRTFFSTQYIRHHSKPLYTPEPDIVHELMGHAPMFADPDFADFSQQIGLAAIGASDEDVKKLAHCYWFTVEFGLCKEKDQLKAFGAGLLSSFGEIEYAMSDEPQLLDWDPFDAAERDYPITTYQPTYYVADNFRNMKIKMDRYIKGIPRPFNVRFDATTQTVQVDRDVVVRPKRDE